MIHADIAIAWFALSIFAAILTVATTQRLAQIPCYPVACEGFIPFAP
jgi:hypothetical protein